MDIPPSNGKAIHQVVDQLSGVMVCAASEMSIFRGGQDTAMTENSLYFEQIDACFNQVSCITVAQIVWRNLFFIPQAFTTLRKVV